MDLLFNIHRDVTPVGAYLLCVWRSSNHAKKPDSMVDSVEVKTIHLSAVYYSFSRLSSDLAHWVWFWSQVSNEGALWRLQVFLKKKKVI